MIIILAYFKLFFTYLFSLKGIDISVCVVEKASEVGGHILSGNVFEPRALDELFPTWKEMDGKYNYNITIIIIIYIYHMELMKNIF